MQDQNSLAVFRTINVLIIAIVFIIALFLTLMRVDQLLKNNAVESCGKLSSIRKQLTTENTIVTAPSDDVVKNCLKEKGYN